MTAPRPPLTRPAFRLRRIKRTFQSDWRDAIRSAYEEIDGDAPPRRLRREQRAYLSALRRAFPEVFRET
jgi:hypothetical protein